MIGEGAIDPDPVIINNSWDNDTNELLCGPGGADVSGSEVSGQYRLFFHAYASGTAGGTREMYAHVLTIGSDGYTPQLSPLAP
ncbi:MAG TPA: hypothetical protein VMG38_14915 [Trebonia sp.]|nr:hypothetical protein [Trebonia sp.]